MTPLGYFRNWTNGAQRAQQPFPETTETKLQDLPIEVRVDIWKYLDSKDQKSLRQQCKQFRWEIDQSVGVNAILTGPKKCSRWRPSFLVNPDSKRAEDNLNWVTNSVVRGLNLSSLNELTFEPQALIDNTHILHRLRVELNDNFKLKAKVMEMLNMCNNLRVIDIHFRLPANEYFSETYRNQANSFHQEILQSLLTKPDLKNLSIIVKPGSFFESEFVFLSFPGTIEEPAEPLPNYPSTIQMLKIEAPILKNSDEDRVKLTSWKAFIDQQQALTQLELYLGFVHWTYFLNVIRKNRETLKRLTLILSNSEVPRTAANWHDVIPVNQHLDWTELLPNPIQLTVLKVAMSSGALRATDYAPHPTRNFADLNLDSLQTLKLRSVFLNPADFNKIFALPNLTHVDLDHWSTVGQTDDQLTQIGLSTFKPVFHALLGSTRLQKIVMLDLCVIKCPTYLRKLIEHLPNYTTIWSNYGNYKIFHYAGHQIRLIAINELSITRNPQNELVPHL